MPGQNIPLVKKNMEEVKSSRTVTYRNHDGLLVTHHYGGRNVKMEFEAGDKAAAKKSE